MASPESEILDSNGRFYMIEKFPSLTCLIHSVIHKYQSSSICSPFNRSNGMFYIVTFISLILIVNIYTVQLVPSCTWNWPSIRMHWIPQHVIYCQSNNRINNIRQYQSWLMTKKLSLKWLHFDGICMVQVNCQYE